MPGTTTARVFRFGTFEVNEATGELRKEGIRIKLHSQPFQALVMLLERPSELVTREEMRQRLWGDDTIVDFDHGLNTAVNKIRDALCEIASQPRYVETVSGRGYRFIAPVTVAEPVSRSSRGQVLAGTRGESPVSSPTPLEVADPDQAPKTSTRTLLAAPHDLPDAPRALVRTLLLLIQAMYLAFYLGALANIPEIREIFADSGILSPAILITVLVISAVGLIPVRLFLFTAVVFDFQQLAEKFNRLFPVLLWMDLLWALSPFLLIHHINGGLSLGMTAALVYMPFAQRSLVLMSSRDRARR